MQDYKIVIEVLKNKCKLAVTVFEKNEGDLWVMPEKTKHSEVIELLKEAVNLYLKTIDANLVYVPMVLDATQKDEVKLLEKFALEIQSKRKARK